MKTQRTKYAHLIVGLAIGFFSSSLALHAQTMSTIRGTVADATGAVVPGAEVTVTEVQTQVTVRTVTSNAGGDYEVPDVVPGVYRVTAALDGFKPGFPFWPWHGHSIHPLRSEQHVLSR